MKNLSDFKRALTLGSKWETIRHLGIFKGKDSNNKPIYEPINIGIREVSVIRSYAVAFKTLQPDGTYIDSYLVLPKAKDCKFINEKEVEIYQNNQLILTFKKIVD